MTDKLTNRKKIIKQGKRRLTNNKNKKAIKKDNLTNRKARINKKRRDNLTNRKGRVNNQRRGDLTNRKKRINNERVSDLVDEKRCNQGTQKGGEGDTFSKWCDINNHYIL